MIEEICNNYKLWMEDAERAKNGLPKANFHLSAENYICSRCDGSKSCAITIGCKSFYAEQKPKSDRKSAAYAAEGEAGK